MFLVDAAPSLREKPEEKRRGTASTVADHRQNENCSGRDDLAGQPIRGLITSRVSPMHKKRKTGPADLSSIRARAAAFRPARLLAWYAVHQRALPWRARRDPYAVWVSEIMLQQTRVETAIPYYLRFVERFPDVPSLAKARLDSVLKIWQGLGYYRRARDMHRAAREILRRSPDGRLPSDYAGLRTLPGMGEYTAAAVASIAFDQPVAAIDGNVQRVMSRYLGIEDPVGCAANRRRIAGFLMPVLTRVTPSVFNQALMELGALVCRAAQPECRVCPLCSACRARQTGRTHALPVRSPLRAVGHERVVVAWIQREDGRLLIARRPTGIMFGGMWELPGGKVRSGENRITALHREINEELGVRIRILGRRSSVRQTYSHFRVTVTPYDCLITEGIPRPLAATALRWADCRMLARYAFPLATRRIIAAAVSQGPA